MGMASELGLKLLSAALSHHSGGAASVRDVGLLLPQDSLRLLVRSRAKGWVLELACDGDGDGGARGGNNGGGDSGGRGGGVRAGAMASEEGVPHPAALPGVWRRLRDPWHHSRACRG